MPGTMMVQQEHSRAYFAVIDWADGSSQIRNYPTLFVLTTFFYIHQSM